MAASIQEATQRLAELRRQRQEAAQAARQAAEARQTPREAPDPTALARQKLGVQRALMDEAIAANELHRMANPTAWWEILVPVGAGRGLLLSGVAEILASLPRENVLAALREAEIID